MANLKREKNTVGLAVNQVLFIKILSALALTGIIVGCVDSTPALDNLMIEGKELFVAYDSPDPVTKSDTMKISFHYNSSKVSSLQIALILDSGKTWFSIAEFVTDNSNQKTIAWVPKNDSLHCRYFGKKEGYIRVTNKFTKADKTVSNENFAQMESEVFTLIGAVPYILTNPQTGETFKRTDTIRIEYGQNQDLSSHISVGFLADTGTGTGYDNVSIDNRTERISESLPLSSFVTKFVPQDFSVKARNYAKPVTIYIADYGQSGLVLRADSIAIVEE